MLPIIRGQHNITSGIPWATPAPPPTLPILGFFGVSPQPQPHPFFNQENLPFPAPTALWNHTWNMPPQPVSTPRPVGRPILGRRAEYNQIQESHNDKGGDAVGCSSLGSLVCNQEETDRGTKRSRPSSTSENWSQDNQGGRKCTTLSPYSALGVNTSIPPPPIVNLPRSKESECFFHPISQSPCNPVELHVTNLDQSIDLREMKKLLMSAFREHVMVLHVSVFVQSDGTLAASVKVPSMQDAQYAISQLHRRKVGFKRIMIAHAHSTSPQHPQYIKNQIASLLLEVPTHKMPLFTFRELFASRYLTSVSVSDLYRMKDVCVITEENSGRSISLNSEYRNTPSPASSTESVGNVELPFCMRHSQQLGAMDRGWAVLEQPSLANVRVRLPVLTDRITSLVQSHNNWLPLASLMECYSAEFEQLEVSEGGAPLEHLVTCINGVELVHLGINKHLRLAPPKLLDTKIDDSLVMCVSPSLANQVNQFARELVDLLKMQPHCQLLFNRFIPAYHHQFGRQCRVADYGFTKLIDLLETLPHVVQVMGEGNKRVVTLSHRAQVRRFTSDLLRVLKAQASKQLMVSELHQLFERTLGHPFDPVDYGLCYMEDLLSQLSANIVLVSGEGGEMTIAIPKREQTPEEVERTKVFALQAIELMSHAPQCSMDFAKFIPAYHHHFGTQCRVSDFGFTKLRELFEAIPDIVKMEDKGEDKRIVSLTQAEKLKVLANQLAALVQARFPPGLSSDNILSVYLWQFGYALNPSSYGCQDLMELLRKLSTIKVVGSDDNSFFLIPANSNENHILCLRTLRILWDQEDGQMSLADFEKTFQWHYQQSCGRHILETELQNIVEVSEDAVALKKAQIFGRNIYKVLCACEGRVPLGSVGTTYQRVLGTPLVPADYGYSSVATLLQAINHVAAIHGKANNRMLVLNSELAAVGIPLPSPKKRDFCNHSDGTNRRSTSQSFLKGIYLKMNGDKSRQDGSWNTQWNGQSYSNTENETGVTENNQSLVIHLPEPRTPPSREECMALLSPANFLLPAHPFPFLPSPPDASELPKPGPFNLTQKNYTMLPALGHRQS